MLTTSAQSPLKLHLLSERRVSSIALLSTFAVLAVLFIWSPRDSALLLQDYPVNMDTLKFLYILLIPILGGVFWFEPQIHAELVQGKPLVIFLAGALSFAVVWLNAPREVLRTQNSPFSLWVVIVHIIFLAALAVWSTINDPSCISSQRLERYALLVAGILGAVLMAYFVISVGRYMELDLSDETDIGSYATSYADTGIISRPFLASLFGAPDPVGPKYLMVMGLWLRLAGTSLIALRAFPLFTGLLTILITAVVLWHMESLTLLPKLAGIACMMAFPPFFRASHNLRYDIGLAVYTAVLLASLVKFFSDHRKRWLFLAGLTLYIGLETVPSAALIVGVTTGMLFFIYVSRHSQWQEIFAYVAGAAIAGIVYTAGHFLPDPVTRVQQYIQFVEWYRHIVFARPHDFLGAIIWFLRFDQVLSPIGAIVLVVALVYIFRIGSRADRWIAAFGVTGIAANIAINGGTSYGYLALFAPFVAYLTAKACKSQSAITIGVFVLLAALVSAPIHDMAADMNLNLNQRRLDEVDLLTWRIPEGVTVVGDSVFWFTLEHNRRFIGWVGVWAYTTANHITIPQALEALKVDYVICLSTQTSLCDSVDRDKFEGPIDFVITEGKYWLFKRRNW